MMSHGTNYFAYHGFLAVGIGALLLVLALVILLDRKTDH